MTHKPLTHKIDLQKAHQEFLQLEMCTWDAYKVCLRTMKITENELWILLEIESGSPMICQADIARRLSLPIQTVNSALTKMAAKGWIELYSMPNNRKSKGIRLTEQGKAECLPSLGLIREAEHEALGILSDKEINTLLSVISRYNEKLESGLQERFDPDQKQNND